MTLQETKIRGFSADKKLIHICNKFKNSVQNADNDKLIIIDGAEGSGKSVFAMQVAKLLNENFSLNDIVFNPTDFIDRINNAKKHQVIVFDEAYTGLSSRQSLSQVNKVLVSHMMQMRQKNLFVIIVLPTIFMLEKYCSMFRSDCLFHINKLKKGNRRKWRLYNRKNKKLLLLHGSKTMSYSYPKIMSFRGFFPNTYVVNEDEYRKMKEEALMKGDRNEPNNKYKEQRDLLLGYIKDSEGISYNRLAELLQCIGFTDNLSLKSTSLKEILANKGVRVAKSVGRSD